MLVGIDGNEANVSQRVGVHQYSLEIIKGLYKLQDNKNRFLVFLKTPPLSDLPKETEYFSYEVLPNRKFWILTSLMPILLERKKVDVFFSPHHYLPLFTRSPKVCTIHDLGYLNFSAQFRKYDFWQLKYWSAISISISKYIICPSKSTAKDIVRHYPFSQKKVKIVYHGFDNSRFNTKISKNFVRQILKKYRIYNDYLLVLSTLKPSKNIEKALEAFYLLKSNYLDNDNIKLVVAGKKGWLYKSIFEKVKSLKIERDVIFTGYLEEKEKPALIKGAKAFVLASFWEGFGMDVVNAMACGTPVVISRVASLPEIAQNAAIYVEPESAESIARGILKVLIMDKKSLEKLIKRGLNQAKKFSWEKSAKQTLRILETAANKA